MFIHSLETLNQCFCEVGQKIEIWDGQNVDLQLAGWGRGGGRTTSPTPPPPHFPLATGLFWAFRPSSKSAKYAGWLSFVIRKVIVHILNECETWQEANVTTKTWLTLIIYNAAPTISKHLVKRTCSGLKS